MIKTFRETYKKAYQRTVIPGSGLNPIYAAHLARVTADGGLINNSVDTKSVINTLQSNNLYTNTQLLFLPESGIKTRVSGLNTYISKGYDIKGVNDLTQATEGSQPRLTGNIPANEKHATKNINGGSRFFTHNAISFTSIQAWSATFCLKWFGSNNAMSCLVGKNSTTSIISLLDTSTKRIAITNESGATVNGTTSTATLLGKLINITFVGNLTSLLVYVDGVLFDTLTVSTEFNFSSLIKASSTASTEFYGEIKYYRIQSGAMTSGQVITEHNVISTLFTGCESVIIGEDEYQSNNYGAVCTVGGDVITNITENSNLEKIVGGNFESGLVCVKMDSAPGVSTWTLNTTDPISGSKDGRFVITTPFTNSSRPILAYNDCTLTEGKYYKFSFNYKVNSGSPILKSYYNAGTISVNVTFTGSGTYTIFYRALAANKGFTLYWDGRVAWDIQIDDISLQEVGWSGCSEIYDFVYAATSGDAATKDAAAVKAAAGWCYYNNDADTGAIYGKLYNRYAAKAINNAFTAISSDWEVPLQADLTTLSASGGNAHKIGGTSYWTTANGSNSTGLTMLGTGYRTSSGVFSDTKAKSGLLCSDAAIARLLIDGDDTFAESEITLEGFPIRLKKRITELVINNPYSSVNWDTALVKQSFTHKHAFNVALSESLAAIFDFLPISNYLKKLPSDPVFPDDYYGSAGIYPPERYGITVPEGKIFSPNFEVTNVETGWGHLCCPGSLAGFIGQEPSRFFSEPYPADYQNSIWDDVNDLQVVLDKDTAYDYILDGIDDPNGDGTIGGLKYADAGGVIFAHNRNSAQIIGGLDRDTRVLGMAIYNPSEVNDFGYFLTTWDTILSTGRRCFGYAEPDNYGFGCIRLLLTEWTEHEALKAIREGRCYSQILWNNPGLKFTRITDYGDRIEIRTEGADNGIKIYSSSGVIASSSGNSLDFTYPKDIFGKISIPYLRVEAYGESGSRGDQYEKGYKDEIYSQPIMFNYE